MLFAARAGTGMMGEILAPLGYRALVGIGISWEERWQLVDMTNPFAHRHFEGPEPRFRFSRTKYVNDTRSRCSTFVLLTNRGA
jgi:hypothetical protein